MLRDRYKDWIDAELKTIQEQIVDTERECDRLRAMLESYEKARKMYLDLHSTNGTSSLNPSTVVDTAIDVLSATGEMELLTNDLVEYIIKKGHDPAKRRNITNILNQEAKKPVGRIACRGKYRKKFWSLPQWEGAQLKSLMLLKDLPVSAGFGHYC